MRLPFWEARLTAYLKRKANQPFAYGVHDCCLFAAGAIEAVIGLDPMAKFRGYHGIRQARRILGNGGGLERLVEQVTQTCRFSEVSPLAARRGDVLFAVIGAPSVGICDGWFAQFTSLDGLKRYPLSRCARAWRVD